MHCNSRSNGRYTGGKCVSNSTCTTLPGGRHITPNVAQHRVDSRRRDWRCRAINLDLSWHASARTAHLRTTTTNRTPRYDGSMAERTTPTNCRVGGRPSVGVVLMITVRRTTSRHLLTWRRRVVTIALLLTSTRSGINITWTFYYYIHLYSPNW